MSLRRWTATTAAMAAVAWALVLLGPHPAQAWRAVTGPQALVDVAGVDALLVPVAAAAGWACWAWGVVGLALTALSALPGAAGRTADLLLVLLVPAAARRLAAVAVGLSLGAGAPLLVPSTAPSTASTTVALTTAAAGDQLPAGPTDVAGAVDPAADWPSRTGAGAPADSGPPDWPGHPGASTHTTGDHVVLRGDCLWEIAADWLAGQRPGTPISDADTLAAVHAWWAANEEVIGADPDVLLPGQVLSAPPPPPSSPLPPP
jgi:nucleoid-associated protein YgaU